MSTNLPTLTGTRQWRIAVSTDGLRATVEIVDPSRTKFFDALFGETAVLMRDRCAATSEDVESTAKRLADALKLASIYENPEGTR